MLVCEYNDKLESSSGLVTARFIDCAAVCPQSAASQVQVGSPTVHCGEASHYSHCSVSPVCLGCLSECMSLDHAVGAFPPYCSSTTLLCSSHLTFPLRWYPL